MSAFARNDDDCTFLRERLELFLDGELSGSENLRFQTHLKECEECAEHWADDEAIAEALLVAVAPVVGVSADVEDSDAAAPAVLQASVAVERSSRRPITHHSGEVVFRDHRPSALLLTLAAAAAAVITFVVLARVLSPDEADLPSASAGLVARGDGDCWTRDGDGTWAALDDEVAVLTGAGLRTDEEAFLELVLPSGSALLGQSSSLRLVNESSEAPELELLEGRVSVDTDGATCRVILGGFAVEATSASFDIRTMEESSGSLGAAQIDVWRGAVAAIGETGRTQIHSGECYVLVDGELLDRREIVEGRLAYETELQRQLHQLREENERAREEGRLSKEQLQQELEALRLRFDEVVRELNEMKREAEQEAAISVEKILEDYLAEAQSRGLSSRLPSEDARRVASQLQGIPGAFRRIGEMLESEPVSSRRAALTILLSLRDR